MSENCLALRRRSTKEPHSAALSRKNRAMENRNGDSLRVSPGKIVRAQGLLIQGHSRRSVSRQLRMSERTVAKIVRTQDFQGFIKQQRERLFAIVPDALESFRAGVQNDPRLAYLLLRDLGVIPSREELLNLTRTPPQAPTEDREERIIRGLAAVIAERHRVFGIELPPEMQAVIDREEAAESTVPTDSGELG